VTVRRLAAQSLQAAILSQRAPIRICQFAFSTPREQTQAMEISILAEIFTVPYLLAAPAGEFSTIPLHDFPAL
jgi:hypothetical protein